ncbi:hypothetical protein ACFFGT_10635 [Mucilaginibacter angelicae]|uniref:DUF3945 domain-containing protein n=1 Tax=Mucilaginibacter angelicae TaxID=869718 RepID=A0ABV6L5B1_9SPHI
MEIREHKWVDIAERLENALKHNLPWVAFNDTAEGLSHVNMEFFTSAKHANDFCIARNYAIDLGGESFNPSDYRNLPVANLQQVLRQDSSAAIFNKDQVETLLQLASVQPLAGSDHVRASELAISGSFFPVQWTKIIQPVKEVVEYQVIHHTHLGHHVYEIGHEVSQGPSFDNYENAARWLKEELKDKRPDSSIDEHLIIGRYRDKALELNVEGRPESYCGITLALTAPVYDPLQNRNIYELQQMNTLGNPAIIRHFLYARVEADGILKLYDDSLKPADPEQLKTSAYPVQFTYEQFNTKNEKVMKINEESYSYAKDMLLYTGFGEDLAKPLRDKMEQGLTKFTLEHKKQFGPDTVESVLHFAKGTEKDIMFFNKFDMTLKQPGKEDLKQTYFVGTKHNYTLQERYNMLDGRYVYREQPRLVPTQVNGDTRMRPNGETYLAWRGVNFKETDSYGNFLTKSMNWDHQRELGKFDIKQMADDYDRRQFLQQLQKGNSVKATVTQDGQQVEVRVAANPRLGKLDFYDQNGQKLDIRPKERVGLDQSQSVDKATAKEQKQEKNKTQSQYKKTTTKPSNAVAAEKRKGLKVA